MIPLENPVALPMVGTHREVNYTNISINFRFKSQAKFDEKSFLQSIRDDSYNVDVDPETLVSLAVTWYSEEF